VEILDVFIFDHAVDLRPQDGEESAKDLPH
jgi:hypothetical protein